METQKTILLAALFFLTYLMWQSWNEIYPAKSDISDMKQISNQQALSKTDNIVPEIDTGNQEKAVQSILPADSIDNKYITVNTDTVSYKINLKGGDISQVQLLRYNTSLQDNSPMSLLNNNLETLYIAPNGLTGKDGPDTQNIRAEYTSEQLSYEMPKEGDAFKVNLILNKTNNKDVKIIKSFTFKRNKYDVDVSYTIQNNSSAVWNGNIFSVLKRKDIQSGSGSFLSPVAYSGLAAYNLDNKFHKLATDKLTNVGQNWETRQGWVAMIQHYFISTWIPNSEESYKYIAKSNVDGTYMVTLVGPQISVEPGATKNTAIKFYAGPEQADQLEQLAPGLTRTIDYGIMWPIASLIFLGMKKIYNFIGNWGYAIILITILIKILFYRLSSSSYRSMAKLRLLAPKIEQLKKRYGDERDKMGKAMMELYKKEKVNPLGGCLPMLIQLPFFIALYWVIIESVELRQAPFVWWINDLSVKDPFYILPVLMGLSMFVQQKLSPAPADPTQEKVMLMMPIVFTILFMYFPAGLVLYWVVNTITSIMQQWWITRSIENERACETSKKRY